MEFMLSVSLYSGVPATIRASEKNKKLLNVFNVIKKIVFFFILVHKMKTKGAPMVRK